MSELLISRLIAAALALGLIGFGLAFAYTGDLTQVPALVAVGLGLVSALLPSIRGDK